MLFKVEHWIVGIFPCWQVLVDLSHSLLAVYYGHTMNSLIFCWYTSISSLLLHKRIAAKNFLYIFLCSFLQYFYKINSQRWNWLHQRTHKYTSKVLVEIDKFVWVDLCEFFAYQVLSPHLSYRKELNIFFSFVFDIGFVCMIIFFPYRSLKICT